MLDIDGTIIIAMISFIVFGFIMNAVLYKPVMKIIEERKEYLSSNSAAANEAITEARKYSDKRNAELERTKKEAKKTVSEGSQKFKIKQTEEIKSFFEEQKARVDSAKEQMNSELKLAENELDKSAKELADIIIGKVLGKDRANV